MQTLLLMLIYIIPFNVRRRINKASSQSRNVCETTLWGVSKTISKRKCPKTSGAHDFRGICNAEDELHWVVLLLSFIYFSCLHLKCYSQYVFESVHVICSRSTLRAVTYNIQFLRKMLACNPVCCLTVNGISCANKKVLVALIISCVCDKLFKLFYLPKG